MTLGQKLKKLRTEKGLTQKDLAEQLHVTFQTVSKWESDTNEPDIATLKDLAKLYGCSFNYLLSDEDEETKEKEDVKVEDIPAYSSKEAINNTTIIIQKEDMHVCAKCGKDIPMDELVAEDVHKNVRHGRTTKTVSIGQTYYHKNCFEQVKQERKEKEEKKKIENCKRNRAKCFGWSIAVGVVAFIIALIVFIVNKEQVPLGAGIPLSFLISYMAFAMIYGIIDGSYIGHVFLWCASLSIKFPGLIFSWSIEGFAWLIAMKILFAVLGFLIGVFALLFAIALSSILGGISFPFILIHDIHSKYENAL